MTESKKGHNFAIQVPTERKKIHVRLFFVLMLHIKFQIPSSSSSLVLQPKTIFYKSLTEFYQISLKILLNLTDFSSQHMACMWCRSADVGGTFHTRF